MTIFQRRFRLAAALGLSLTWCAAVPAAWLNKQQVEKAHAQFDAVAKAYKSVLLQNPELSPSERQLVARVTFKYAPGTLPEVVVQERLGATQVMISAGWLWLAEEALRGRHLADLKGQQGCFDAYVDTTRDWMRAQRKTGADRPTPAQWKSFEEFVGETNTQACRGFGPMPRLSSRSSADIETGMEGALAWLMGRELSRLANKLPLSSVLRQMPAPVRADCVRAACPQADTNVHATGLARALKIDLALAYPALRMHVLAVDPREAQEGCPSLAEQIRPAGSAPEGSVEIPLKAR